MWRTIATVGGNRYGWFDYNQFPTLAFDNASLTIVPEPTGITLLGLGAGLAAHNLQLAVVLLGWAYVNRVIQAIATGWGVMGDIQSLRLCWLYPVRDLMGFFVWCASFTGSEIVWRNERYRLLRDGKMLIQRDAREQL